MAETTAMPSARALAAAIRNARESSGIGQREVSRILKLSHSVISYWETGKRVPSLEDVASYLTAIGVTGDERERILELARDTGEENWLTAGAPGASKQLAGIVECERTTTHITIWAPMVIPGLLQTSEYARAILGASGRPRSQVDAAVSYRLGRRDMLTRMNPAPLDAIVGEGALRQCVGGREIMAHQLRYLLETANRDSVTLRIVPEHGDWHPGLMGQFVLYEFEMAPTTVHLEHHRSGVFLTDSDDVAEYKVAAETLRELAISPDQASGLIADIANELREEHDDDSA